MKRRLTHIFIAVLFVTAFCGTAHTADFHKHLVRKGETLSEIAQKYKVPLESIIQANRIKSANRIRTGRTLQIPTETLTAVRYTVKSGDTLYGIARRYKVDLEKLQRINNIKSPHKIQIGTEILIGTGAPDFARPLKVPLFVTSGYGYRRHPVTGRYQHHAGIDFRAATGTRVYAAKAGRVIYAGRKNGYGKVIGIEHTGDFTTWYGHLSRIRVKVGETVRQGKIIGLSGNTGISTGPHLHFEIRYKGRSEKPTKYITIP